MNETIIGLLVELAGGTFCEITQDPNIPWKTIVTIKGITDAQATILAQILHAVIAAPFSIQIRVYGPQQDAPIVNISGSHTL